MRWTLTRWPGPQLRDQEAALAADAPQLVVGAHERRPPRDAIADLDVASHGTAAVAGGERVAREAAGITVLASACLSIVKSHSAEAGPLRS